MTARGRRKKKEALDLKSQPRAEEKRGKKERGRRPR